VYDVRPCGIRRVCVRTSCVFTRARTQPTSAESFSHDYSFVARLTQTTALTWTNEYCGDDRAHDISDACRTVVRIACTTAFRRRNPPDGYYDGYARIWEIGGACFSEIATVSCVPTARKYLFTNVLLTTVGSFRIPWFVRNRYTHSYNHYYTAARKLDDPQSPRTRAYIRHLVSRELFRTTIGDRKPYKRVRISVYRRVRKCDDLDFIVTNLFT